MFKVVISNENTGRAATVFISKKETMEEIVDVIYPNAFEEELKGRITLEYVIEEE